ncbi:hypothetical protein HNR61_008602 [Actinomadura namibiensis]|uniref:Uncharacterized protein n=1 Tax=Actinomadura namibiensis TaxID=182080 RepID=A0A7W3LZ50_ACTNM|nr:hypothetical protein [Actinomadura namibiensis]
MTWKPSTTRSNRGGCVALGSIRNARGQYTLATATV